MKHRPRVYAKALVLALAGRESGGEEALMKNFLSLIERNGDGAELRKIVREAERMLGKQEGIRRVTVESARPLDDSARTLLRAMFKRSDVVQEKIDPELVAGLRIAIDEEREFDGSLKGKLDSMFS